AASADFTTSLGAFDTSYNGGSDVFVTKLTGSGLAYATYLGGSGNDRGFGPAVDSTGAAYVTGETVSADFPTTLGAFDTSYNGGSDVFVMKLTGSGLAYATYLGGSGNDRGFGLAVDGTGAAYVTGETASADFPTTLGAFAT